MDNATFVIIAVKPADVESVMGEVAQAAAAADRTARSRCSSPSRPGITIAYLESKLPAGTPVVRVMPNAPALVGAGITALAKGRFVTDPQLEEVSALFDSVGGVLTVPEDPRWTRSPRCPVRVRRTSS